MQLGEDRQVQAQQGADLFDQGAGGIDKARRGDRVGFTCRVDL